MKSIALIVPVIVLTISVNQTSTASVLAGWTFETSHPATFGPFSPETGSGQVSANTHGTISSPTGNGSANSFSSTGWKVGDYFQFSTGTLGFENIAIAFDQTSSAGGPVKFNLNYSTDGTAFTIFAMDYLVRTNASGMTMNNAGSGITTSGAWSSSSARTGYSYSFDLSAVMALNNASTVYFRLVDDSSINASGATIDGTGTDRVDNFMIIATTAVPEPSTVALVLISGLTCCFIVCRKR